MDWTSFLSIFSPEWIFFAIIIAAAIAIVVHIIFSILDLNISAFALFILAFALIIFVKIEGWYDVVGVVRNALGMVILWMH